MANRKPVDYSTWSRSQLKAALGLAKTQLAFFLHSPPGTPYRTIGKRHLRQVIHEMEFALAQLNKPATEPVYEQLHAPGFGVDEWREQD